MFFTRNSGKRSWILFFRFLLLAIAIIFFTNIALENKETIELAWRSIRYVNLLLSTLLSLGGFFLFPVCIWQLFQGRFQKCPSKNFISIQICYHISNFYKYIPGKISTLLVMIDEAGKQGVDRMALFHAWVGNYGLSILIGMCLAFFVIFPFFDSVSYSKFLSIPVFILMFLAVIPTTNMWLMKALLIFLKRDVSSLVPFSCSTLLKAFAIQLVAWLLLGLSFAIIADIYLPLDAEKFFFLTLGYPVAHTAGFLVMIAPAGLGVREGVLVAILMQCVQRNGDQTTLDIFLFIVIVHRMVITLTDSLLLFIAYGVRHCRCGKKMMSD